MTDEQIAQVCHEANRAYAAGLGEPPKPSWADAPDWQRESAITGVLSMRRGFLPTPEAAHESWLQTKVDEGWAHGKVLNTVLKLHPCVLPYDELPPEQKLKDKLFLAVATALLP